MTLLLNDISELSRIETGALVLRPEELWMEGFIGSLLEDLRPQAAGRRIRLRTSLPEALKPFRFQADPLRLHQLLENLLSNAIKFSPEDSEVMLSVDREGSWLTWSVIDRGMGIAPSEAPRIFERFYRSPQARGVPGTGLGLSIVKHLSALMGGEIDLKSELGQGATFTLRIPTTETKP
jgi:two-component system phosphate regulon sensor histidine kinase PhoR